MMERSRRGEGGGVICFDATHRKAHIFNPLPNPPPPLQRKAKEEEEEGEENLPRKFCSEEVWSAALEEREKANFCNGSSLYLRST